VIGETMTTQIKSFLQTLLATFDHSTDLTWATVNDSMTTATFSAAGMNITVRFSPLNASCLVDFQVKSKSISTVECLRRSMSIYYGVLQALKVFHRIHGPVVYRFADDDEGLAELWEMYRECPRSLGYESERQIPSH
jgi:hypothetical protein